MPQSIITLIYVKAHEINLKLPHWVYLIPHHFPPEMATLYTPASRVQSMMWPAISQWQSLVTVESPGHRKTFGWLLPLINSLADKSRYNGLPSRHSPQAIMLCPNLACASLVHGLVASSMQLWLLILSEGLDILTWWELVVKPGLRKRP